MRPSRLLELLTWWEQRSTKWAAAPASVGLTQPQVESLVASVAAAREIYDQVQAIRAQAKAETLKQGDIFETLESLGSDDLRYIRAFAESKPTQAERNAVYAAALIDPPLPPQPAGPPVAPENVTGDPNADGTVTLKWKGSTSNQTFFTVWRQTGNNTQWQQVGVVAAKKFVDETVPSGTPAVRYFVKAQRASQVSPASDEATVNFGQAA